MKDAFGHGSNPQGGSGPSITDALRSRLPGSRLLKGNDGGGQPMSSNAAAAEALTSTLKSTQAPVHQAMVIRTSDTPMVGKRTLGNAINRELVLRARHGGFK